MNPAIQIKRSATFDAGRAFRFRLTREYQGGRASARVFYLIACNPSAADEASDDATIRKVVSMLRLAEGGGTLVVFNLDPTIMTELSQSDIDTMRRNMGEAYEDARYCNRVEIRAALDSVSPRHAHPREATVIAAWGAVGERFFWNARSGVVRGAAARGVPLWCWGCTKKGAPRHPLYLPRDTPLVRYEVSPVREDGVP